MRILEGDLAVWRDATPEGSSVAIGVFDGVHLGHQKVLSTLAEDEHPTVVVTFDQHPLQVVAPEAAPRLLTSLEQRIDLFGRMGVDVVGVLPFGEVRNLSPEAFVDVVIVGSFAARVVVVGTDFRFGHNRDGDLALLETLGRRYDFEVRSVRLIEGSGQPISSTAIRIMVASGRVEEAASALGRLFELRGVVVRGEGRGRRLGVPTANLEIDPALVVPGHGVYAAWADLDGLRAAAVNVGIRPTFGESAEVVEVHILDFDSNLYGEEIAVHFHSRIRDERAFDSPEELVDQLRRDLDQARDRLESLEAS